MGVGRHRRQTASPQSTLRLDERSPGAENTGLALRVQVPQARLLTDRGSLRLEVAGAAIVLTKVEGRFYAVQEYCTHRYGPLSEGASQGFDLECPWHRSCFDIRTGAVTHGPAKENLKSFPVEERDGQVWITVPHGESQGAISQPDPESEPGKGPGEQHNQ